LILDGGNKLKKFRKRVKAALERSDDKKQLEDSVKELEGLVQEISALKIMQVYPKPSSLILSIKEAYKLKAEYKRMIEEALRKLRSST